MLLESFRNELLKENSFSDILGQEEAKKQFKSVLLSRRHVIIVGAPGVGKTTLAKNIARFLPDSEVNDCEYLCSPEKPLCPKCRTSETRKKVVKGIERFIRVQGSPELTAEDIIGDIDPIKAMEFGPSSIQAFTPGKLFKAQNGILFFDEINRCSEKLQNSLLQVLEEGCATIGSYTVDLPVNFVFIATMNPEDTAATEQLSDVLMDRLDTIYMKYPESLNIEKNIVVLKGKDLGVVFPDKLLEQSVSFIRFLRENSRLSRKPGVRASLGLYERAQAYALVKNKGKVSLDDIKAVMISVLSHRIELKPSVKFIQSNEEFLGERYEEFLKKGGCL